MIKRIVRRVAALGLATLLAACGGGGNNQAGAGPSATLSASTSVAGGNTTGGVLVNAMPYMLADVSPQYLGQQLTTPSVGGAAGVALYNALGGSLPCSFRSYYIQYSTKGALGEDTTASGTLLVPHGGTACEGRRDVVLYSHAPNTQRAYNLNNLLDTTNGGFQEAGLIAATFAAQGYIVIASNYAGYDTSNLPYHAFLNAQQKSREAIDTLVAGRTALANVSNITVDSGRLFLTGYSEGGWTAMATLKAMEAAGNHVVATAALAGPYATAAYFDAIMLGNVNAGSTFFFPLLTRSYQVAYGNVYTHLSDVYTSAWANGTSAHPGSLETLSPGQYTYDQLVANGQLPLTSFFNPTPPAVPHATDVVPASVQDLAVNSTTAGVTGLLTSLLKSQTVNINLCQGFADNLSPPKVGGPETTVTANQQFLFNLGFQANNLVQNTFRGNYLADFCNNPDGNVPTDIGGGPTTTATFGLRADLARNDMRSFIPKTPILMCGGGNDPTVFFINTEYQAHYWGVQNVPQGQVVFLNLDNTQFSGNAPQPATGAMTYPPGATTTPVADATIDYTAEVTGFTNGVNAYMQAHNNDLVAYGHDYHQVLLPPWCAAAALKYIKAH